MRSESCLKELLWVQASSAGVYVQIAVTASVQDPPGLPVLVSAMEEKVDLDRELREFVKPYGVHFGLQNDPAAALTWESVKLAFGHAYDAAEVMFGHEDAEELVEIAIKRLPVSLDTSMAQSARMRRLPRVC